MRGCTCFNLQRKHILLVDPKQTVDKSDTGNASICVQALASLLGPVAEEYYNEIVTFDSPLYPINETMQCLFDDYYQSLVVYRQCGEKRICCSSIFMPVPRGKKLSKRHSKASLEPMWIGPSMVSFDNNRWEGNEDLTANDTGIPPNVKLPLRIQNIRI